MVSLVAALGQFSAAAGLASVVLSGARTPSPRAATELMGVLEAGLTVLGARDACTTQCEYLICSSSEHKNYSNPNLPSSDGGEVHECTFTSAGCSGTDHACAGEEEQALVAALDAVLGQLDGPALDALAQRFEKFQLNQSRGAAQILGCDNQVLVSRSLSPTQILQLGISENR